MTDIDSMLVTIPSNDEIMEMKKINAGKLRAIGYDQRERAQLSRVRARVSGLPEARRERRRSGAF